MLRFLKNYINSFQKLPKKYFVSGFGLKYTGENSSNVIKLVATNFIRRKFLNYEGVYLASEGNTKSNKYISDNCYNVCKSQSDYKTLLSHISDKSKSFYASSTNFGYNVFQSSRSYSTNNERQTPEVKQKMLMDYPLIVWPSFLNSIRIWFLVYLIIKPYYETEFSLNEFCKASKQALMRVSHILSEGELNGLKELIDENALDEVKKNFSLMSVKERLDLAVNMDDIFFYFPYQAGLIFNNDGKSSDRVFLEITMCFHVFRGFREFLEKSQNTDMRSFYQEDDRVSIANYRFIREITKGSDDDWTINIMNHFKPIKLAPRF